MDKKTLTENLEDLRDTNYRCWRDYHERCAKESGRYLSTVRDMFEMHVRALDYAMEALRNADVI